MLRARTTVLTVIASLLLTACGMQFGAVKPETFSQTALLATNSCTAALETIDALHTAGKLSADEAREKIAEVDKVKEGIDAAVVLYKSKPTDAENDLERLLTQLNALSALLKAREAG